MARGKAHIMWVPNDGIGKIRSFLISPSLLGTLSILMVLCLCAVPFLEKGILSLSEKIADLEDKREGLQAEIVTLRYLKGALRDFEEKERRLRTHFGMEQYESLEEIAGGGSQLLHFSGAKFHSDPGKSEEGVEGSLQEKVQVLGANYDVLHQLNLEREKVWELTPSIVPVALDHPRISSGFGWRMNPFTSKQEFHAGIDIIGPKGTKIVAPSGGRVINAGYDRWLGNYVVLEHSNRIKTIYGHLSRLSVQEGEGVKRGDLVGLMGNTGLSTNHHLHYGVIVNNRAVDPMQFILDMAG
ncbi:MAG: M23 family metallopeptidase [Pseudomonadota bacterium]